MLRQKFVAAFILITALIMGVQDTAFAKDHKAPAKVKFKVRIENISTGDGLAAQDGSKYSFAVSPGFYAVTRDKMDFFKVGKKASQGLEAQAEDGNPELLSKKFLYKLGSARLGIFNTPVGADTAGPVVPGGVYEFEFYAEEGMKLNLVAMYGQSNDLFYAPERALDLFSKDGQVLTGDITEKLVLWDAGTEVNEAPGIGPDQAPRQKMANTGAAENGNVGPVKDAFMYPNTKDVLRVTITAE